MILCARVKASSVSVVACGLHSAIRTLDGHPLVESVHVRRQDDLVVEIFVSLDGCADATRYGFHSGDTITSVSESLVEVERRGKTWPLMRTHGTPTVRGIDDCTTVRDTIEFATEGGNVCVPNAPYLTVDVLRCFSHKEWSVA